MSEVKFKWTVIAMANQAINHTSIVQTNDPAQVLEKLNESRDNFLKFKEIFILRNDETGEPYRDWTDCLTLTPKQRAADELYRELKSMAAYLRGEAKRLELIEGATFHADSLYKRAERAEEALSKARGETPE